jgi:hypothetical protein
MLFPLAILGKKDDRVVLCCVQAQYDPATYRSQVPSNPAETFAQFRDSGGNG